MLDSILKEKYKKLQEKERRYRRYDRPASWTYMSFFLNPIIVLVVVLLVKVFFNFSIEIFIVYGLVFGWYFVGYLIAHSLQKRARVYRLDGDEWVTFFTCSTLENMQNYSESKTSELKKEYRKKATRSAKELLSRLERYWTIGDFKLARTVFGDTLSELKDNFRKRVIPNLEKGDSQTIRRVGQVMYNFAQYVRYPTSEGLGDFNKTTSNNLPLREPTKFGFYERCSIFLEKRAILKHVLATIVFVIASCFVFFIGVNIPISKEGSYIAAIALFGALEAGYWQRSRKER